MYEADSLHLNYKQQHLPRRYESEEEDISESELGHDTSAFSPVDSYQPEEPSDLSESVMEKAGFPRLLSARPVSMDTVKRSSDATFVADPYMLDHDDDVIIELPSPDSNSPLQSPIFLQPSVYVPPESPVSSRRHSAQSSLSSSSVFSDEETDVCTAEQVTYVEPIAKPNIILISPVSEHCSSPALERPSYPAMHSASRSHSFKPPPPPSEGGLYSLKQAATSQPLLSTRRQSIVHDRSQPKKGNLRLKTTNLGGPSEKTPTRADMPPMPHTASARTTSMTFPRPSTSISEKPSSLTPTARRAPTDSSFRRPPSMQNLRSSSFSLFHARHNSAYPDDSHSRSISVSHSAASSEYSTSPSTSRPPSRTASPASYYCSPTYTRERSGSVYSASSLPASATRSTSNRPPLPIRNSMMNSSTSSSVYSASSLRSEVESLRSLDPSEVAETDGKQKLRRKKSLIRRSKSFKPDEQSTTKSFMDFMRGKRKSTIKPNA